MNNFDLKCMRILKSYSRKFEKFHTEPSRKKDFKSTLIE